MRFEYHSEALDGGIGVIVFVRLVTIPNVSMIYVDLRTVVCRTALVASDSPRTAIQNASMNLKFPQ